MASNPVGAQEHVAALRQVNDRIGQVVADWQATVGASEAAQFAEFAGRIAKFQKYAGEIARRASEDGPQAAGRWSDGEASLSVRQNLNRDLEKLAELYAERASRIYAEIDSGIDQTALWLSIFAALAVMLAIAGVLVISRGIAQPLAAITRVTETVAAGDTAAQVPFAAAPRRDRRAWRVRSACSRTPCARTRNSTAPLPATPICARASRSRCRMKSRGSPPRSRRRLPNSAASPSRCWPRRHNLPAPPTAPRKRPRARLLRLRKPQPTCTTSPRPPMSCRSRSSKSTGRWRSPTPSR